jgi:hypothetical protein
VVVMVWRVELLVALMVSPLTDLLTGRRPAKVAVVGLWWD